MYGLLAQIAILVAMTHGLRVLGRIVGPRRCGLVLGLPCSTALLLVYCGHEHGVGEALAAAESGLPGALAAATLPLAYARAIRADARRFWAPLSAVAGYVAIAAAFRSLPVAGAWAWVRVGLATAGVLAVCGLAGRGPGAGGVPGPSTGRWLRPPVVGTLVPMALVVLVRMARALGGSGWAGLFTTFPGMSLALLVATHLEDGPASACRLARAMPPGNLITIAFLSAFRLVGPRAGLGWGTACGCALATATLLALEALSRPAPASPGPPLRTPRRSLVAPWNAHRPTRMGPSWARVRHAHRPRGLAPACGRRSPGKRFAPRIEFLPG